MHTMVRAGTPDSVFEGGIYYGRIMLPTDYPLKAPNIIILTVRVHATIPQSFNNATPATNQLCLRSWQPNGRFSIGQKICLNVSAYHPEEWHPAWTGVDNYCSDLRL